MSKRKLKTLKIEALPIINDLIDRCELKEAFEKFVPSTSRTQLEYSKVLLLLLRNIMLASFPLYKIPEWASNYSPTLLGLSKEEANLLNDDRIGRSLDILFLADRATLLIFIMLYIIEAFHIDTKAFHNDSTTVSFYGRYKCKQKFKKLPVALRRGFNKDHRPDLKQLLFNLVVSHDGAIPIHFKLHDGNITDDTTHIGTWNTLKELVGHSNFIYVADSKLCTNKNMKHISTNEGNFITVLPKNRKEYRKFIAKAKKRRPKWEALWYRDNFKSKTSRPNRYKGYESQRFKSKEGYRIIWIHSLQKQKQDIEKRDEKIKVIEDSFNELIPQLGTYYLKTRKQITKRLNGILQEKKMKNFFSCKITSIHQRIKKQISPGRPGANTSFRWTTATRYRIEWEINKKKMEEAARADGIFPLITNAKNLSMREVLKYYKYQPNLEKRHSYLKSVLEVAPIYLKTPERIEALLFLYFLALLLFALLEREISLSMKKKHVGSLPIYPEQRECRKPTTERIFAVFRNISFHQLYENDQLVETFYDPLNDMQSKILDFLTIPLNHFTS